MPDTRSNVELLNVLVETQDQIQTKSTLLANARATVDLMVSELERHEIVFDDTVDELRKRLTMNQDVPK